MVGFSDLNQFGNSFASPKAIGSGASGSRPKLSEMFDEALLPHYPSIAAGSMEFSELPIPKRLRLKQSKHKTSSFPSPPFHTAG